VAIHTLPYLECTRLVSVRSSLPCINIGVRIELTLIKMGSYRIYFLFSSLFSFLFVFVHGKKYNTLRDYLRRQTVAQSRQWAAWSAAPWRRSIEAVDSTLRIDRSSTRDAIIRHGYDITWRPEADSWPGVKGLKFDLQLAFPFSNIRVLSSKRRFLLNQ